jgi:hypothetical protein
MYQIYLKRTLNLLPLVPMYHLIHDHLMVFQTTNPYELTTYTRTKSSRISSINWLTNQRKQQHVEFNGLEIVWKDRFLPLVLSPFETWSSSGFLSNHSTWVNNLYFQNHQELPNTTKQANARLI